MGRIEIIGKRLVVAFIIIKVLTSCNMGMDFEYIDAYQLTINKAYLFGERAAFIAEMGLPEEASVGTKEYLIHNEGDLNTVIAGASEYDVILHYKGIVMETWREGGIIPTSIDFRKTDKSVTYGEILFNSDYTTAQFEKQFPNSAYIATTMNIPSLFGMVTGEVGTHFKHYSLNRKTKDDPLATPMLEFTFEDGKLIFIFFANF